MEETLVYNGVDAPGVVTAVGSLLINFLFSTLVGRSPLYRAVGVLVNNKTVGNIVGGTAGFTLVGLWDQPVTLLNEKGLHNVDPSS